MLLMIRDITGVDSAVASSTSPTAQRIFSDHTATSSMFAPLAFSDSLTTRKFTVCRVQMGWYAKWQLLGQAFNVIYHSLIDLAPAGRLVNGG